MNEGEGARSSQRNSLSEALDRADEALRKLEQGQVAELKMGKLTRSAVFAVVVLAWAGLIVHTFFEDNAPQVDSTSVALLAVALIAPFVSRLKALEVGGAKAEWQDAAVSLKEILGVLRQQQDAISQLFGEVTARVTTGADTQSAASMPESRVDLPDDKPRTLRRVLWVDDHPENNTYELESLRQILDVVTAKTNEEAFAVLRETEVDAVISDVNRDFERSGQLPGGVQLLRDLNQDPAYIQLPVLFYTSTGAIQRYGADLEADGALIVTSLFSDLLRMLRQVEEQFLEITARVVATRRGNLRDQPDGTPDVVVELPNGSIIGIEVASWLQRPQMSAFVDRANHLLAAIDRDAITHGVLLARPDVLDDRRRMWAAERKIELASPDRLAQLLDEHART
ncbi:response regulator [Kribbella sp. CA-253562]|uniref:response regulator n=1 Tax=Kribbella sp. CA-253562 TaxID=3239942 RepID=UPI003D8ED1FA